MAENRFPHNNSKTQKNKANKVSLARKAAFDILLKIEKEKAFSSILLPIYEKQLEAKDRALCHELTLGTLRKQIYLDKIIELFTNKKLDLEVRIALRIGLYQLLFLDKIPIYSAINESVNLVAEAKKTSAKGFVNAILRRVSREKIELNFVDEIERISVETSHPRWLIERWIEEFGLEETRKLAVANNETPDLDFRWTAKTSDETRLRADEDGETGRRGDGETNPKSFRAELFELAEKGEIYFQDKASQLVGKTVDLQENEIFLDVCAAPGSKLTQVAIPDSRFQISDFRFQISDSRFQIPESEIDNPKSKIQNPQSIIAGDLYFQRVKLIRENAVRQGVKNIKLVQYDAEKAFPFADETFDVILLDAPCSGTGTIRHNPEIRYHLSEKDFIELSAKQLNILKNASKILKRGGRLIYSTCSLEKEENEGVIEKFLASNENFAKIRGQEFLTEEGFSRTFPHRDKMDGFFIARLKKF